MSATPETTTPGFKPKKSVALSGTAAGNTALCTVGRTGNDLAYRGYDILDLATTTEFEEIAHLLVHGKLPTVAELASYKAKLKALRGIPAGLKTALEQLPPSSHPMDVMRTGVSVLGCLSPEKEDHNHPGARDIADKLMASLGSMLLYWYHYSHNGKRIDVETDDDSIGGHFLHLLHGEKPRASWVSAMHTSLILYAEHEFNASTFTARVIAGTGSDIHSAITGAIGALRGPKHGGANEVAHDIQKRYDNPDEAEADIRNRGLERYFTFTGPLYEEKLLAALNAIDIGVSPDPHNAMNDISTMNKVMEYMTLEKPVVQFDLTEGRASAGDASLYARANDPVDFANAIAQLIETLIGGAPLAQKAAKDLIAAVDGHPINDDISEETAQRIARQRATSEAKDGIAAFLEKRTPAWLL